MAARGQHLLREVEVHLRLAAGRHAIQKVTGKALVHPHRAHRRGLLPAQRKRFVAQHFARLRSLGFERFSQILLPEYPNKPPPVGRKRGERFFLQAVAAGGQQLIEQFALPWGARQEPRRFARSILAGPPAQGRRWQPAAAAQLLRQRVGENLAERMAVVVRCPAQDLQGGRVPQRLGIRHVQHRPQTFGGHVRSVGMLQHETGSPPLAQRRRNARPNGRNRSLGGSEVVQQGGREARPHRHPQERTGRHGWCRVTPYCTTSAFQFSVGRSIMLIIIPSGSRQVISSCRSVCTASNCGSHTISPPNSAIRSRTA